ncbi:hypothetical protein J6590_093930 [Homalodisca vitripennis]|nr:hypothetical protein J6590_093930 [Homalodisca vitripennis]
MAQDRKLLGGDVRAKRLPGPSAAVSISPKKIVGDFGFKWSKDCLTVYLYDSWYNATDLKLPVGLQRILHHMKVRLSTSSNTQAQARASGLFYLSSISRSNNLLYIPSTTKL